MSANMDTIDNWLLTELKIRDWSQADLARHAGVSRTAISDIISGKRKIGRDLAVSIAEVFKLPLEEVYRRAGILPPQPAQDETLYRISHLYHTLKDEASKIRALEFLEFLSEQEDKNDRKGKGS
jgi:transcriptional regulator with XRE-family HTH domain